MKNEFVEGRLYSRKMPKGMRSMNGTALELTANVPEVERMNNLLRTLTESQVKSAYPDADLRLLLTTVKESRRQSHDIKVYASDPFFDSLENLLLDLKAVTIDNHDAEAFLKPVSKAEAPDYYEVIANPMDFSTMLKKVKARQYKSKREFKDDLDLIWSNCLTYNAAENHPLRPCVKRLKLKADRLLKYITDRKDRADPPIPSDITATHIARPKINGNGVLNGRSYGHQRSPSTSTLSKSSTPTIKASPSITARPLLRRDAPFPDTPAITRTPAGMALFMNIDRAISTHSNAGSTSQDTPSPLEKLQELAGLVELPLSPDSRSPTPDNIMDVDVGEKRKLNGFADHRPRKRTRFNSQYAVPLVFDKDDVSELWWSAVQSDTLLANGLPQLPFSSSTSSSAAVASTVPSSSSTSSLATPRKIKAKRRKKQPADNAPPKSLLTMMNNNIKTMKRLRHTHAKFAALNANNTSNGEDPEGGDSASFGASGPMAPLVVSGDDDRIEAVDHKVDERPWRATIKGKRNLRGIEIGEEAATDCMKWMGRKVLEHAGFQGTSQVTLDVLSGVASDFLLNVGRTIRFLSDKYAATMTPEEIILHTLFESGISKIQELERYVSDDVERYGARLTGLEEKLIAAYRESTAGEVLEDEGLFEEEDEEEAGVLAIGDFADALGEDYLGLRELGIAAEFGLSNLSIPKKLLSRKKSQKPSAAAKPTEPPPPYPPPPPFLPFTVAKVEDQIGLLKPYFQTRFNQLALSLLSPPVPTTLPGPSLPALPGPPGLPTSNPQPPVPEPPSGQTPYPPPNAISELAPPVPPPIPPENLVLADDLPNPVNVKMGPLGQIVRGGPPGAAAKKKKAGGAGPGGMGAEVGAPPPKKKKTGMVGVGTGNGRKKKGPGEEGSAPAPTPASAPGVPGPMQSQPSQPQQSGLQSQPGLAPVTMPMTYLGPPPVAAYTMPMPMQLQPSVMGQ
ncbi:Programmed cell death protein 6 [Termitomyces sp. T112]|nr:Programmed cell death protein 6 [Termitomyces sp. T112]